jgi:dipeptidase E
MRLLLTSSGVTNASIRGALVAMLGQPIEESRALVVPTGIYPFPDGAALAAGMLRGESASPFVGLGWKSWGLLEPSVLPSIDEDCWLPALREADAVLVWGGDPVFVAYWLRHSGLADAFSSLASTVYFGVSAGSIATAATFAETYRERRRGRGEEITTEDVVFTTPGGELRRVLVTAHGLGLVDVAIIPHVDFDDPDDVALAEQWAARIPAPTYALDDQSALAVVDGALEVVTEGRWRLFGA